MKWVIFSLFTINQFIKFEGKRIDDLDKSLGDLMGEIEKSGETEIQSRYN